MNWTVTVYSAILFFLLTPGILLSIPKRGSKYTIAGVHALVFAVVWHFTHKQVCKLSTQYEGMADEKKKDDKKKEGYKGLLNGKNGKKNK